MALKNLTKCKTLPEKKCKCINVNRFGQNRLQKQITPDICVLYGDEF